MIKTSTYLELYEDVLNLDILYEKSSMKENFNKRIRDQSKLLMASTKKYFDEYTSKSPDKNNMMKAIMDFKEGLTGLNQIKSDLAAISPDEFDKEGMGAFYALSALFGAIIAIVTSHWANKAVTKSIEKSKNAFTDSVVDFKIAASMNDPYETRKQMNRVVDNSKRVKKQVNTSEIRRAALTVTGGAAMTAATAKALSKKSDAHAKVMKQLNEMIAKSYQILSEMTKGYKYKIGGSEK